MALTSLEFLIFVVVAVFVFHARTSLLYRRWVLTLANALFLLSFVHDWTELLPLLIFLGVGFIALYSVKPGQSLTGGWAITIVVILFVYLKRYTFMAFLPGLPFPYLGVGLSYILFRILQLLIDRTSGTEERVLSLHEFFDYTCGFLSFVSGPIQRSGDFLVNQEQLDRPVTSELAYASFARIALGYLKVAVVSACAFFVFQNASSTLLGTTHSLRGSTLWMYFTVAVASYTAYLYYNFAGYMDIVIGIARLLGQDLPENFDHPFRARNLFEFWSRWHMTLSEWFKTYLFNPLLGLFVQRAPAPTALPYLGVFAFFVTFFVMGVWHGSTLVFVVYGLLMGAGVSTVKVWQMFLTARLGKKAYRDLGNRWLYANVARGITCAFFAIAVTALWVDFAQMSLLVHELGVEGLLVCFALLTTLGTCILPLSDRIVTYVEHLRQPGILKSGRAYFGQLGLAAQVLLILVVASFFHKAPEFVYKAF
ncbi:MAG: MBOAT family O-acyltransferase [Burkholderiaceae bacterium]|jgi:D-alanyl-lipoteichoic acid acyltransferase DltB (MBOAT superfamily)